MSNDPGKNTVEISENERQLLYHLSLNGRSSLTELGRKMDLTKQAVSYLINRLEALEVISGYYAIVDIYRLGRTHYRVFLKLQKIRYEDEQELLRYLESHPLVAWVLCLDGEYDLFFVVWSQNINEFQRVYDEIMGKFGYYFQKKSFSIATQIEYLPYHFLHNKMTSPGQSLYFGSQREKKILDHTDTRLITMLNRQGRASLIELAQNLNISPSTVRSRIRRLTAEGIVIGFNVKINFSRIGYIYQKVLLKLTNTSTQKITQLQNYLREKEGVIYLLRTIGPHDFEFELITGSNETGYALIKELRLYFNDTVYSADLLIIKDEPKYEWIHL